VPVIMIHFRAEALFLSSASEGRDSVATPKTDDFRLERRDGAIAVTFTPTGATYTYELRDGGALSEPSVTPARVDLGDYGEADIRKSAADLARLAVFGGPHD
jgi:hypothetical protein